MSKQPQTHYLKDYLPPLYEINSLYLHIDLGEDKTYVHSVLDVQKKLDTPVQAPLILDGEALTLQMIAMDGRLLSEDEFEVTSENLTIFNLPLHCRLEIQVEIKPENNTKLMGIYKSGGNYVTQCEPHGFRRITYFLDRPDVLTHFVTTITADKARYPVMLANGNQVDYKILKDGRHWAKWEDPSLKPCYLFALVAGNFDLVEDCFITQSQRTIQLQIFVEKGKKDQAYHAMACLKHAMKWDEETFGREYDLDQYMIVSVNDFNFGAMENKGLNIFNDVYILAKPETATDMDYLNVEAVIGHEYFHNWSGNRVTIKNWFQITLKEGLTVLREQLFMEKIAQVAHRIAEVSIIRNRQFVQDDSPMAHPIRPNHYIEINNFYTVTVYNKGAEVIRMVRTLLGSDAFRKAMDLYFSRYDGLAITTEDFLQAMMDSSGVDLTQFQRWYSQAGTPRLMVTDDYDVKAQVYTLTIEQFCPKTLGDIGETLPFHIPIKFGLLDKQGNELTLEPCYKNNLLEIKAPIETFVFHNIPSYPVPSLLRDFSAPVKLHYDYTPQDLMVLLEHDSDEFNRWDAMQKLFLYYFKASIQDAKLQLSSDFIEVFKRVLESQMHPSLIAQLLTLPNESYLLDTLFPIDIDVLHSIYIGMKQHLAKALKESFLNIYHHNHHVNDERYHIDSIGKRALKNVCLYYLLSLKTQDGLVLCKAQWKNTNNMTDRMGALQPLMDIDCPERTEALANFYQQFEHEALSIDKWFRLQAQSDLPNVLEQVQSLLSHPKFDIKNPNRVRALIGSFAGQNLVHFHRMDGKGYEFLTDQILIVDPLNPMVAARLAEPLTLWRKMDEQRQLKMRQCLEKIKETETLSRDLYEIISKSF